jgi:hypothetical protein
MAAVVSAKGREENAAGRVKATDNGTALSRWVSAHVAAIRECLYPQQFCRGFQQFVAYDDGEAEERI